MTAILPRLSDRQAGVDPEKREISLGERRLNVRALEVNSDGDRTEMRLRLENRPWPSASTTAASGTS